MDFEAHSFVGLSQYTNKPTVQKVESERKPTTTNQ
jgi:hypothetical protein